MASAVHARTRHSPQLSCPDRLPKIQHACFTIQEKGLPARHLQVVFSAGSAGLAAAPAAAPQDSADARLSQISGISAQRACFGSPASPPASSTRKLSSC
jgi:hypothetical protein